LVFDQQILAVENLDALRAQARVAAGEKESGGNETQAAEFPAEDTPLQVPPEIERLRNAKPRPVSA
jgi:hypothetical protein